MVEDANVLLVTTRERAAARAKEDAEKLRAKRQPQQPAGPFSGAGVAAVSGDPAAEIAKLKEENEQLKRHLEETQKQLKRPTEK